MKREDNFLWIEVWSSYNWSCSNGPGPCLSARSRGRRSWEGEFGAVQLLTHLESTQAHMVLSGIEPLLSSLGMDREQLMKLIHHSFTWPRYLKLKLSFSNWSRLFIISVNKPDMHKTITRSIFSYIQFNTGLFG